ncbi:DUF5710 domain-containing protein [Frateuria aurantia]
MPRTDLKVPFSHKDEAKSLGARWDPSLKVWYVPDGVDIAPLVRWLPVAKESELQHEPDFMVRSPYYYVIESSTSCWKCLNLTRVFSFFLPEEHEQFEFVEDEDESFTLSVDLGKWVCHGYRGTVSNISDLSRKVANELSRYTKKFKSAYSKGGGRYMMNHCEHCGSKQGDFYMHCEPGGAFFPVSPEDASRMILNKINDRFEANCGVGFSTDDFMDCMRVNKSVKLLGF